MHTARFFVSIMVLAMVAAGCRMDELEDEAGAVPFPTEGASPTLTDTSFLTDTLWNDGQAEIAFYEVERTRNQYDQPADQRFLVGTYVVKHDFDPVAQSKAREDATQRVSSFKYGLFYEFESRSYEYKRSYVLNAVQADLTPLKHSFTSFDWCSNLYREMAFMPDGTVDYMRRSDDYGNEAGTFAYQAQTYPISALPLLVRSLDFSETQEHDFGVVQLDGSVVRAQARLAGTEQLEVADGVYEAERIVVTYEDPVPSMIGERSDPEEMYWRSTGTPRLLLQLEAESGRYRMTLVEHLRSPYWSENLYPRLKRVAERP